MPGGGAVAKALTGTFESSLLELGELLVGVILTGVLLEEVQGLGSREARRSSWKSTGPGQVLGAGKTREGGPQGVTWK